jgi:tetratricopeptide (TPR) repeat protein
VNFAAAARAPEHADRDFELSLAIIGRSAKQRTCPGHEGRGSCADEGAMAKIGRNEPCPCGSGKKYKRCCQTAVAPTPRPATVLSDTWTEPHRELCPCCVEKLEERADRVADELIAGHLDEAEALCRQFIADYPDEAEGLDLLSMILQERGERDQALDLLRRASAIAHARTEYDLEVRSNMRQRLTELELSA